MPLPKNTKDLAGVRDFFTNLKTQFASASVACEGPIKTLFDEVTGKLASVLEGLPKEPDNNWTMASLENGLLFELLSSANNLVSSFSLEVGRQRQLASAHMVGNVTEALAAAVTAGTYLTKADHEAGVTAAVTAAIAARTGEAGDLVPKTRVDQLCSAAKTLGITEGRAALQAELDAKMAGDKLVTDRTAALTTAGLPLPEADQAAILRGTEELFCAAKTTVEARLKGITEAGLQLPAELLSACWQPEAEYQKFHKTVTSIPALKVRGGLATAEPFASLPAGGGAASTARMLG